MDEARDVFSKARCDLHAELLKGVTFTTDHPADVDAAIRALLLAKLKAKAFALTSAQSDYMAALIGTTADVAVAEARAAYIADLRPRYAALSAALGDPQGVATLRAAVDKKKDGARRLFPAPANPLPVLDED